MKKLIFFTLFSISILILSVQLSSIPAKFLSGKQKAGIKVLSTPLGAEVLVDGSSVGKTPFEDEDLKPGKANVRLKYNSAIWVGGITLNDGTVTILNRDLAESEASSSGEILTLSRGSGANIISDPEGATVEIDGKVFGKTPISVSIGAGEHIFVLSKNGYLKRSIKALVPPEFNLGLNVDLALSELDLSSIVITPETQTPKVKVLSTPTGFLRVRDKPNLTGKEIARVLPGDELIFLEELTSWNKVRLLDGKEGYVSSQYVEKISQ